MYTDVEFICLFAHYPSLEGKLVFKHCHIGKIGDIFVDFCGRWDEIHYFGTKQTYPQKK
ncbi:hypothetical protein [Methanosarcina lacustris]|nr:hypothetical protein [Methanosarcina lacustris]